MQNLAILAVLRVFCAADSQLRVSQKHKMSRFWLPTTAVWRTRHPHTRHQERASISRAVIACEELQLPTSTVQTFRWGYFF